MSTDYLISCKSIGLSKVNGRKPCTLDSAAKHNKRELAGELEGRGRITADRVGLNYCLHGPADSASIVAMARTLLVGTGANPDKMRHDYCQAVEVVFSLPANTAISTKPYFSKCLDWARGRFGAENALSCDVHLDEGAPHCHVLVAPVEDGKWIGGKLIERTRYQGLVESFFEHVASSFGLSKPDKLSGTRKATAVAMVLRVIERSHRELIASALWLPIRKAIERSPTPFVDALGLALPDKPEPKLRTMAQIFTSPGAGPKRESTWVAPANPKGIDADVPQMIGANPKGIGDRAGGQPNLEDQIPKGIAMFATLETGKHRSLPCERDRLQIITSSTLKSSHLTTSNDQDVAGARVDDDGVIYGLDVDRQPMGKPSTTRPTCHGPYRRLTANPVGLFTRLIPGSRPTDRAVPATTPASGDDLTHLTTVRVKDDALDADAWDAERGEFVAPVTPTADTWATSRVASRTKGREPAIAAEPGDSYVERDTYQPEFEESEAYQWQD